MGRTDEQYWAKHYENKKNKGIMLKHLLTFKRNFKDGKELLILSSRISQNSLSRTKRSGAFNNVMGGYSTSFLNNPL